MTPAAAFAALRKAGLRHNDPDIVRLFDTSDPDFVAKARAAKPELFLFDARSASDSEVDDALKQIEREATLCRYRARTERAMASLAAEAEGR